MKVIDPHLDIADLSHLFNFSIDDFYSDSSSAPITFHKLKEAEVQIAGFSLYCNQSIVKSSYYAGVQEFVRFYDNLTKTSDDWHKIQDSDDLINLPDQKIGYLLTIEGLDCLRTPDDFDEFYDLGVRSFGFTWNLDNQFACGVKTKNDTGLSRVGFEVLDRMKARKNILLDLSHLSAKTVLDLDKHWPGVLAATHSNARSVYNNPRNLTDDQIQIIVDHEGVIGVFPLGACTGPQATFDELYQHIDYIASRWGLKHVGLCSDIYPLSEYPFCEGYTDITIWCGLKEYLAEKLSESELEQVCYGNWMRVLKEVLSK